MKIALLGPAHPFRGGIVHFNSRLARALQNRPELDVNLFYWSKPYPAFLLPGSASACLDEQSSLTFHQPGLRILSYSNPLTWGALITRLRRGRYDMFITHWVHPVHFPVFKVLFAAIRLLTKTKICLIVHNCLPHEHLPGAAFMSRSVLKMAHRLVVHGETEAQQARRIGLAAIDMVTAFHPIYDQFGIPVEPRESIRRSLGLREKVLLFFGFIRLYKGLDCLLNAFYALAPRYPDVSLLVVGEQFYTTKGEACGNDLLLSHLSPNDPVRSQIVRIDRYVKNEEVGRYFVVADALVTPYLSATQSGPLQVAYAFDKPVIASDLPAFRECVSPGESGYLFSTGNSRDLTEKMELFLKKPIAAEQVRQYRRQFSWDRYVDRVLPSRNTGIEKCLKLKVPKVR
jgi:glycosyltransferase involved in cell wall biosynthesis